MLGAPEPKDPQDAEVATMLIKHPQQFERVAREWAIKYASAPKETSWEKRVAHHPVPAKPKSQKTLSKEEVARQEAIRYERKKGIFGIHTD